VTECRSLCLAKERWRRGANKPNSGDVFVHRTDLPANAGALYEGRPVSFEIDRTHRGLRAINIAFE
jgi:cold shock CspA family protein